MYIILYSQCITKFIEYQYLLINCIALTIVIVYLQLFMHQTITIYAVTSSIFLGLCCISLL